MSTVLDQIEQQIAKLSSKAVKKNTGTIRTVADGSPNYRDGVFHNLEPASALKLDAEENRLILFDMISSRSASRPGGAVPLAADVAESSEPVRHGVRVRDLAPLAEQRRPPEVEEPPLVGREGAQ